MGTSDFFDLHRPRHRQTIRSMDTPVVELPHHPVPHVPPVQEPSRPQVQAPTVIVYEQLQWEYRVLRADVTAGPAEEQLNALGRDGWELAGVASFADAVHFYLKRQRT
jgi:hypothetical protein